MNLFIDTNIYLTFYHFTSEDLEELRKLLVLIDSGKVKLFITSQVIDEFNRNREAKVSDALNKFKESKIINQFPQICKQYPEFRELREFARGIEEKKAAIIEKLLDDIENKVLGADKIILELFEKAEVIKLTGEIFRKAELRIKLGNPPGKNKSYGDAINWESLLLNIQEGQVLRIITDDSDYISQLNDNKMSDFLIAEWEENKKSPVHFYKKLSAFFKDKFPDIKLASELEKELAISKLIASENFISTHLAISRLSKFTEFSDEQINQIIEAATTNSQIYLIRSDADVKDFLLSVAQGKEGVINPEIFDKLKKMFEDNADEEKTKIEEVPF